MLEVYPGRDEVMGVHVGRVVHESAKERNTRMVAIGIISSRRFCNPKEVSVLGATIAISGVVIKIQGLPAKVRIIFVSSL